ncbi:MAG: sodium ion-translocating decarboxylase subunit beta [Phycisphaeraceae bacterium]
MDGVFDLFLNYLTDSGFGQLFSAHFQWGNLVMIGVGILFITLAIKKGFEPLLLLPIGFGILLGNVPYDISTLSLGVYDGPVSEEGIVYYVGDEPIVVPYVDDEGVARTETLAPWSRIPDQYEHLADDWVADTLAQVRDAPALMVNTKSRYTVRSLPEDFEPPGIYRLGQGRMVLIDAIDEQTHSYPQIWSPKKQDPANASVLYWLYTGVGLGFFPPLIFLGVGALTDFGPLLANPRTLLLGAAAQFGIFGAFFGAVALFGFSGAEAGAIGIIGGADGPTAIFVSSQLAPELLGAVALAAYSYMAMVPIIQPPIARLLTTKDERAIRMTQLKPVSKKVRIIFPIAGFLLTVFIANGALPLLGMLFFGNLLRESLVTDRLAQTAQTAFIDIVTILLGVTVGAKTTAANFLTWQTIGIFVLGITAFIIATGTGVLAAKAMNKLSKNPINPLIGAAGVSAVPMSARVVHRMGQEADSQNFLLMHAMGPNVAGVIGSAVAAGVLLSELAS